MTAQEFCSLNVAQIVAKLDEWDNGGDPTGLREFVFDFLDNVLLPFKPESAAERWSDLILGTASAAAYPAVQERILGFLRGFTEFKPFEKLAAKLP